MGLRLNGHLPLPTVSGIVYQMLSAWRPLPTVCPFFLERPIPVHEMSIVQALIEQVEAEVEKSGQSGRVIGLDLVIGRLSGVHVDSIRFAYEVLAPGSILEGSTLRISEPAAYSDCRACGAREAIEELTMCCPRCGSGDIVIDGGRDLLLQSIELEQR